MLPHGWTETPNEWRRRLRDPAGFARLRQKAFTGIRGVYLVGGPVKGRGGAFVPQSIRFKKAEWPSLTAAVGWFEASRFADRMENPPAEGEPRRVVFGGKYSLEREPDYHGPMQGVVEQYIAYGKRGAVYGGLVYADGRFHWVNLVRSLGTVPFDLAQVNPRELWEHARAENPPRRRRRPSILTVPEQHRLRIAKDTLRMSDAGARIMGGMTKDEARRVIREYLGPKALEFYDAAPEREENPEGFEVDPDLLYQVERAQDRFFAEYNRSPDVRKLVGKTEAQAGRIMAKLSGPLGDAYREMKRLEGLEAAARRENPDDELNSRQVEAARDALSRYFGIGAVDALTDEERMVLSADLVGLATDEELDYERAAYTLKQRIGGAQNLGSYVATLMAGRCRRPNPGIVDAIRAGDKVTIVNRFGQKQTGRAVMRSQYGGWVLNLGGKYGTPGIADESNIVRVVPARRENPDTPRRLEAFRSAARDAIEKLVQADIELDRLVTRALEGRPGASRARIRELQRERRQLAQNVRTAVERHGAALGEFSTDTPQAPAPRGEHRGSRRSNPPSDRAAAIRRFEEFHGTRPERFSFRQVPDLTKLVTLGRALEVHYQAHVPRGERNTPYRHSFGPGATLLTDATGKALVILGDKLSVGRAPRGRLGYIRG